MTNREIREHQVMRLAEIVSDMLDWRCSVDLFEDRVRLEREFGGPISSTLWDEAMVAMKELA